MRAVIDDARDELVRGGRETVLFVDEVHRFTKAQQDALLPGVENRWVTLIAATTENPFFSVISPLLSRSLLLHARAAHRRRRPAVVVPRALTDERGLAGRSRSTDDAEDQLVRLAGGDARRALTYLEAAAGAPDSQASTVIDLATARDRGRPGRGPLRPRRRPALRRDQRVHQVDPRAATSTPPCTTWPGWSRRARTRGSSPAGWSSWPARTSAWPIPTALTTAVAAAQAVQLVGMPEAQLNLAQAVIALALAPKSNAVITAIGAALADVRAGRIGGVPAHLRDAHYPGSGARATGPATGTRTTIREESSRSSTPPT